MSVYIKGMEMPTEGTVIAIYKLNGKFYASVHGTELCPLIPVSKHGRLIDADALDNTLGIDDRDDYVHWTLDDAPTIIPAEEDT